MNKELEEAKEYLKHEVTVYDNNKEINQIIGGKLGEKQYKINKTLLNYIDNSIPKEVIEKKLKGEKELLEEYVKLKEYGQVDIRTYKIRTLQELLEGK